MAPHLIFFIPSRCEMESIFVEVARSLLLPDPGPLDHGAVFQRVSQRGEGKEYLRMECREDAREMIEELGEWTQPSREYKRILSACKSTIGIHYRGPENGKRVVRAMAAVLTEAATDCLVDNDYGCLLKLSTMAECLCADSGWSWERYDFPELPDVGSSEWGRG